MRIRIGPLSLLKRRRVRWPELLANSSVEQDVDSSGVPDFWNISTSGAEWSNVEARIGGRSLRLNVSSGTGQWISYVFAVVAGQVYRLSAYVKGTGSTQTFLTIRWWSDTGGSAFISENNIALNVSHADWTVVEQAITAPAGAQSADVVFRCPAATTADLYGDDFSVRRVKS